MNTKQTNKTAKFNKINLITNISLTINCVFLIIIFTSIALATIFHAFDSAIVNKGFSIMCDESDFRKNVYSSIKDDTSRKQAISSMDYTCAKNGAEAYHSDGLNKYFESIGLPKIN